MCLSKKTLGELLGGKEISTSQSRGNDNIRTQSNVKYANQPDYDFDVTGITEAGAQEMKAIKEMAQKDGTFMKAPNGKDTNLNERQWLQVRTKSFSDWFGDWINNPEDASKVVDKNGELMVVYHETMSIFNTFNPSKNIGTHGEKDQIEGIYFTDNKEAAEFYSIDGQNPKFFHEVFLSSKDPFTVKSIPELKEKLNVAKLSEANKRVQELSKDGTIIDVGFYTYGAQKLILVFSPNQIKSATDNNGNFNSKSDDIRFQASRPKPNFADYSGDLLTFAKDVAEWNLENRKRSNNFAGNNSVNNNIENVRQFIKDVLNGKIKDGKHYIELPEHVNKLAEKVLGHPIKSHRIKADEIRHI
jgi:hypothetical protein